MSQDQPHDTHGVEEQARDTRARQLQSSRLRITLFKNLQVESVGERREALEKIIQVVKSFMRVARSPFSPLAADLSPVEHTTADQTREEMRKEEEDDGGTDEQLQYLLLTMLRLSLTCPFSDVRQACQEFLQITNDTLLIPAPRASYPSPSSFIGLDALFSLESTSSYPLVSYPRPANLSFSPWSHEAESDGMDEPFDFVRSQFRAQRPLDGEEIGRPADEYVRQLMVKTFVDEGRLLNLFRLMVFFPTFYEIFNVTYTKTVKSAIGPLHRTWKCYLGIMTAAEQQCQYLVSILTLDFLQAGGDPLWLNGTSSCPLKLRKLVGLVQKMARQPWRLKSEDLAEWMSPSGSSLGQQWSKGELVQAMLVISTFLGLSSFVMGCGITPELDMRGGYMTRGHVRLDGVEHELDQRCPPPPPLLGHSEEREARGAASSATGWHDGSLSNSSSPSLPGTEEDAEEKNEKDERRKDTEDEKDEEDEQSLQDRLRTDQLISLLKSTKDTALKEELQESLEKLQMGELQESLPIVTPSLKPNLTITTNNMESSHQANMVYEDLSRFSDSGEPNEPAHEEFKTNHPQYGEFMLGEYCWEDHGCDLVNHFLPGIGDDLDDEFNEALSITDWSIFHPVADGAVDTSPLRHAIWFYVQKLYGVTKEDYNYPDIALYLNTRTKEYIRKVCYEPHLIQRMDWNSIGISFRPEEKCHMNLLIASAKKQALLCYGLWLISEV
ncbi:PA26 p53-induced protein-domain-containing protein [Phycomyces blakesleeanus]|uniref:PA26 p53-induced protein-domain-containing protein n=1 Tax=Phycomyces blakesleeanus TaxID=4837 RepID=A0ABR3BG14_PHYBL